jgi:hypothetical protein
MSPTSQIRRRWELDDATVEAIVQGRPVDDQFEPLVAFARQVRNAVVDLPGPAPSDELARILSGEDATIVQGRKRVEVGRVTALVTKVAGLGLAAQVALGATVAAASVAGAGAAGVGPARNAVRGAIEAVSPVEFDHEAPEHPENFGGQVSDDATGESDGEKGVDGKTIAEEAPGAEHRPDSSGSPSEGSGQPDSTGLDRANETPAAEHAPDSVPDNGDKGGAGAEHVPSSTVPERPAQSNGG